MTYQLFHDFLIVKTKSFYCKRISILFFFLLHPTLRHNNFGFKFFLSRLFFCKRREIMNEETKKELKNIEQLNQ
jgi:hypothetical protein